jgi:hypothetical protein
MRITDKKMVEPSIEAALRHPGAVVLDFQVEEVENCYPMMPPGVSLSDTIDQPPQDARSTRPLADRPSREKEYAR